MFKQWTNSRLVDVFIFGEINETHCLTFSSQNIVHITWMLIHVHYLPSYNATTSAMKNVAF
jgi:hypothetical protein